MYLDTGSDVVDLAQIIKRKLDIRSSEILFETVELRRAGDRNHPGLLGENPRNCDLGRCRVLPLGEVADHINYSLVRLAILCREARDNVAEIALVELRIFLYRSGEESLSERTERNESDAKLFECRQDFLFRALSTRGNIRFGAP